jgi:hypothetical protein
MALGNALNINFAINQLVYANTATTLTGLVTANNGVLITGAGGTPSISNTLPNAVQDNITRLGTIVSMTTPLGGAFGGTGINNGANTITLGGNILTAGALTLAGAFAVTFNFTAGTNVTFPTAGTLATTAGTISAINGTVNRITANTVATVTTIDIAATYVGQTSITTLGTITTGVWNGTAITETHGGTNQTTYVLGDTLYASAANTLSKLAGNTTAGIQYLAQTGTGAVSAAPVWTTISGGDITGAALTKTDDTNVTLTLGGTPATALLRAASLTLGWTGQLALTRGGTNANLTASNGGIVWSNATQMQILAGTATANQALLSGSNATPAWSTATYPPTTVINQLLYSSANNIITGLTTANKAVLTTGATGIPVLTAIASDGQVIIGSTAGVPAAATLTAGTAISVTNAGNSITIANTGVTSNVATANQTTVSGATGAVTIGLASNAILPGTGGVTLPQGNTAARAGGAGTIRFNTQTTVFESTVDGAAWTTIDTSGGTVTSVATGVGLAGGPITTTGTVNVLINAFCQGRLTLTSGTAVTTSDVLAATTVYFTPYKGNYIALYTGAVWTLYTFTEKSIAVPNAANTAYDVFAYDSGGSVTLQTVAWTNTTTRATAIVLQDGVECKSGDLGKRYLGSFLTTAVAGQTQDAGASTKGRYLYNRYNQTLRTMQAIEGTASWAYSTATFRQANASTNNQLNFFVGLSEQAINASVQTFNTDAAAGNALAVGVGVNSTTVNSAQLFGGYTNNISLELTVCSINSIPPVGYNFYAWLEKGSGVSSTFYSPSTNAGIIGSIMM